MKEFFTLEGKIEENRRFLRETQEKYEKIREYYPLFFIYIGMLGVYSFDILTYILATTFTGSVFFLSSLFLAHILLFGYVFYLFTKVLVLKDINHESEPFTTYKQVDAGVLEEPEFTKKQHENSCKKAMLNGLEVANKENFETLKTKKDVLGKVIKYSIYSFLIYILLIATYKVSKMENDKTSVPKSDVTDSNPDKRYHSTIVAIKDGKEVSGNLLLDSKTDSTLTLQQEKRIRKIVREELDKIKKENIEKEGQDGLKKMKDFSKRIGNP